MLRYKFRPQYRLKTPNEFQSVFDSNNFRVGCPSMLILAKPNEFDHARLGLVMRKRFVRFAHDRNRVKRVVRESFRHLHTKFPGLDCLVLTRPGVGELSKAELRTLIDEMFEKVAERSTRSQ